MHPFDVKAAFAAKHAQHVVLVHFPIALFLTGVAFEQVAKWTKKAALETVAYLNIVTAAAFVIPVLASGILAWQWQLEGMRLKGVLLLHVVLGSTSGVLICVAAWARLRQHRSGAVRASYCILLEGVTALLIILTGHLGGFLSGVNLPG
jgi:uncharacterized membrane protein